MFRLSNFKGTFIIIFLLPVISLAIYEYVYATDRYESNASLIITKERQVTSPLDLSLLGISNSGSDHDALVIKEFIQSADMLQYLDKELQLRRHYADKSVDWWSRLPADASAEDFLDYLGYWLHVSFNTESKVLHISVQSFSPEFSKKIVETIITRSQSFIDKLNVRVTSEQLRFFDAEIDRSYKKVVSARKNLTDFQRTNKILTTKAESTTILGTIGGLEASLAQKQSELTARLKVLNRDAPQLTKLRLDINALAAQINQEKSRLAGKGDNTVSELDAQFREIEFNLQFVTSLYKANLNAMEQARIEAARRLKFLIIITNPIMADESLFPNHEYILITAAFLLLMLYFVISLVLAIIKEHR